MARKMLLVSILALSGVLAACSSGDADSRAAGETVEPAGDAQDAARDGLASLRTEAERLAGDVQSWNASETRRQLLDRCRDALERLREASSEESERVAGICDRIQDSDPENRSAWDEIRQEIEKVP